MTKGIKHTRREHRIASLQKAIAQLKQEGFNEVTALIVHKKIQSFGKNEQANIREVSNRMRCHRKVLRLKVTGRKPLPNRHQTLGGGKITTYEIL